MKKNIALMLSAFVFAVGIYVPTQTAEAALITDAQVEQQKEVLDDRVHDLLQEELKLVQMIFIQLLEQRIAHLEAQR